MEQNVSVRQILKELKTNPFVLACKMQMGYTAGLPILQIQNDQLCMLVPFLRYKMTGRVDQTLVFPIRYTITLSLPERQPVAFADLSWDPRFQKVSFQNPTGLFRHKAIQDLDREAYKAMREELLASYDRVIGALLWGAPYRASDETQMRHLLQRLTEPSLWPTYQILDPDFYQKYFV